MLLFVSISALINLGIGYVLGAGLTFSEVLEMLPLRRRQSTNDLGDDDVLTRPPEAKAKTEVDAKAAPADKVASEKSEEKAVEEATKTESDSPTDPTDDQADESATEEAPQAKTTAKPLDVMAGLADFREQLASAGLALKLNQENPDKFGDCAQDVQKASHGYIEQAIETATVLADQGDATSIAASEVIVSGVEKATAISEKFDEQLEGELTDEKRAELINQASAMKDAAAETQISAEKKIAPPAEQTSSEPSGEKKSEEAKEDDDAAITPIGSEKLFDQIEQALAAAEDDKSLLVASLSTDPIVGQENDGELLTAITQSLDKVIALALEGTQAYSSAAADPAGRPVLMLGSDTFEIASQRMERLRQTVEATAFQRGDETFHATVTCAITEVKKQDNRNTIETQLMQALDESERAGHNKTYHHDGAFPTALPEMTVETEKRTVQI